MDGQKALDLKEDVTMHAALSVIFALGAAAIERTDHHWGLDTEGSIALSAVFATFAIVKYRQYRAAKDRVFDTWRQKIELELGN